MTNTPIDLDRVEHIPARDLLRLPLGAINILLRSAEVETCKAQSRENWLRAIREEKTRMEKAGLPGGDA